MEQNGKGNLDRVEIPFRSVRYHVTIGIDGIEYRGELYVSIKTKTDVIEPRELFEPTEMLFIDGDITHPLIRTQDDGSTWYSNLNNPAYVKRITHGKYDESKATQDRARDFALALNGLTDGRIRIRWGD